LINIKNNVQELFTFTHAKCFRNSQKLDILIRFCLEAGSVSHVGQTESLYAEIYKPPTALWQSTRVTMLHIGGRLDLPLLYTTHNSHYNLLEKAER